MKNVFTIITLIFILSSCERAGTPRVYVEETTESEQSSAQMPPDQDDPHAGFSTEQLAGILKENAAETPVDSPVTWSAPEGWEEKPGNGMRVVSFISQDDTAIIDCSIVTLGAGAGGIEDNIVRWLGQLNVNDLPEPEIKKFVEKNETLSLKDNLNASVFDFTIFPKNADPQTPSMMVAIVDTPDQRVFVKMMGTKAAIAKNAVPFKALVQSLEFH